MLLTCWYKTITLKCNIKSVLVTILG